MRRVLTALVLCLALGGCAGVNKTAALTQAQGALVALDTLAKTAPLTEATKVQIGGYAAWVNVALQAAGILAPVVEAVAVGS